MDKSNPVIFIVIVAVVLFLVFTARFLQTGTIPKTIPTSSNTVIRQQTVNLTNQTLQSAGVANYAYLISAPILNSTTQYATAGFNITERNLANGSTSVNIASIYSAAINSTYVISSNEKLYYIDISLGDDSPPSGEYSLSDDGVVLTNLQGYIIKA